MIVEDNRLDREVVEQIGVKTTLTEPELRRYNPNGDDRDYRLLMDKIDDLARKLRKDRTTRQAIALTGDTETCIVGVQVLVRDQIHVLTWLRSSDEELYRDDDIGFLYEFGKKVRLKINENKRIMVHLFTSSLHVEV